MNVTAFDSSTPTSSTSSTNNSTDQQSLSGLTGDSFLVLLTAQLKSQDPTAPTDPTEFVGQLVQFNSLEQLIQINQNLQQALPADSTSSNQNSTQSAIQNFTAQNQTSQLSVVA
jgi:flagellar basal-body rod modification protein FlgD